MLKGFWLNFVLTFFLMIGGTVAMSSSITILRMDEEVEEEEVSGCAPHGCDLNCLGLSGDKATNPLCNTGSCYDWGVFVECDLCTGCADIGLPQYTVQACQCTS